MEKILQKGQRKQQGGNKHKKMIKYNFIQLEGNTSCHTKWELKE